MVRTATQGRLGGEGNVGGGKIGGEGWGGLGWGGEDLSPALGGREQRGPDGEYAHVYELARSLCLLAAVNAGVMPIETVQPEFRDLEALETRAARCKAAGPR